MTVTSSLGSLKFYELVGAYLILADADTEDEEGFTLALAQLTDAMEDKAERTAAVIRTLELEAAAIDEEAKRLLRRATARRNRADALKAYLMRQLTIAEMTSVRGQFFTVGIQASPPSVKVVDARLVPETYLVPQPPRVDIRAILSAWQESGMVPPGVVLERGRHLRIR